MWMVCVLIPSDANKNKNGPTRDKTLIVLCEDESRPSCGGGSAREHSRMVFITVHCFRVSGRRKKSEILQTHKSNNKSKKGNSKKKTHTREWFFLNIYIVCLFIQYDIVSVSSSCRRSNWVSVERHHYR